MLRVAGSILSNPSDIEDAVSDAVLSAYGNLHALREDEKLRAWLLKITVRCCYNQLRKRQAAPDAGYAPFEEPAVYPVEPQGVYACVGRLAEPYRKVLVLYYHEGYKAREISAILGCPLSTVLMRISRGRQKLKQELSREGVMQHDE